MTYKLVGQRPSGTKVLVDSIVSFYKFYVTIDSSFLLTREVSLNVGLLTDSERVYVNGLIIKDDCYVISSNILTLIPSLDIAVGDDLDIRYATQ